MPFGPPRVSPVAAALALAVLAGSAQAIPSPDVVVNFFSNAAHAFALGGAYLGGRTLLKRRSQGPRRGGSPRVLLFLGLALAGSVLANFLQYRASSDEKARRLSLNLVRTSKQAGRMIKDENLKTLDFSEQVVHPFGLANADVASVLGKPGSPPILDVREDEEYRQARIAGTGHARYPDVLAEPEKYLKRGVRTVLFCWSGNRSAELVEALRPKGWDVCFVRGGYEKWRADGQPLEGPGATRGDPRDIPDYPNRTRLLDTDDVVAAMRREKVVFLDNRYDTEFNAEHLPNSIQICIRATRSEEIEKKIAALPRDAAYIGVVYDKRSGFFSTVVGSKLTAAGLKYLGRYTVPHELPPDAASALPTASVLAAGTNYGWLAPLCRPLEAGLVWTTRHAGSVALGLILFVLALRLLLLPLSAVANRSAFGAAAAADRVRSAKQIGDPAARRAALRVAYRDAGVRPVVSVVSIVAQLLALMGLFRVVAGVDLFQGVPLVRGWIDSLADPDPWFVLPALTGIATAALMRIGAGSRGLAGWAVSAVTGIAIAALISPLRAAIALYLAVSVGAAAVEKAIVFTLAARARARRDREGDALARAGVLTLRRAGSDAGVGGKAKSLARLLEGGFPVPDGVVLSASFFGENAPSPWNPTDAQRRALASAFASLRMPRVAVRSSALGEDGREASFAGVYESILDVEAAGLPDAVGLVLDSFRSERAKSYGEESPPCVLIQRMIEPEWAGVVFTAHPLDAGAMLVEAVRGRGEDLVQGRLNPHRITLDRETLLVESGAAEEFPIQELARLAIEVERFVGRPQDIEWARADGRFFVLQSRDITSAPVAADADVLRAREGRRLGAAAAGRPAYETLWKSTGLTEDLPRPTPLSLSLMRALWGPDGAVERACRRLALPYDRKVGADRVVQTVFGRLYVNADGERRLFPGRGGIRASWRIERERRDFAARFREGVAPEIEAFVRREFVLDLGRMDDEALYETVRRRWTTLVEEHYPHAEVVNILADWSHRDVERQLEATALTPADLCAGKAPGAFARSNALLGAVAAGRAERREFFARFGHRGAVDYELACPRFREVPEQVERLLDALRAGARNGNAVNGSGHAGEGACGNGVARAGTNGAATNGHIASNGHAGDAVPDGNLAPAGDERVRAFLDSLPRVRRRLFEEKVGFLRAYETLKDDAKDLCLREVALLREAFLEIGRRRGLGDGVFYLTLDEVLATEDRAVEGDARVLARRAEEACFAALELPPRIAPRDLDALVACQPTEPDAGIEGRLAGLPVSGRGAARGTARVVRSLDDLPQFRRGEILVATFTEPAWSVVFPRAGGVVTEVGGALCHTAILAREYGIRAIVGVEGATRRIRTGDLLRLEGDGEVIVEARTPEGVDASRVPVAP